MAESDDFLNQPGPAVFPPTIDGRVIDDRNDGRVVVLSSQSSHARERLLSA